MNEVSQAHNAAAPAPAPAAIARARRLNIDLALTILLLIGLVLVPPVCLSLKSPFWIDVINRIVILAMAATSLSLLISLAGLVSFGHAVYLGIGGYTVGIMSFYGIDNGFLQLLVTVLVSAVFAFLSGLLALRTRGVHFIMITLAFSQMIYFIMVGLREYGGDDGLTINLRSEFTGLLDLENRLTFFYATVALYAVFLLFYARIRASRFGLVLAAAKGSERRVAATGFDPFAYRLVAFVVAGVLCGLSGFMLANFTLFMTPDAMSWLRSGELMFMVVLGGVGTLAGPLIGAIAFLVIEELLGSVTEYWHFWFGLFLIAIVLFARGGIVGIVSGRSR